MVGTPGEVFSRYEELTAMGLDVPQGCQLTRLLREMGGPAMADCYLLESLADSLTQQIKGGDGGAA
jgi:hypothetical protein